MVEAKNFAIFIYILPLLNMPTFADVYSENGPAISQTHIEAAR